MRLLNRVELAEVFGVAVRTVASWADQGLPTFGYGHRRYRVGATASWLLERGMGRLDIRDEWVRDRARQILGG
jgi:phage terminase Nu1 subunit (DNA packaging protein)